jgi:hypothetical protein
MKRIPKSFRILGHTITVTVLPAKKWPHGECVGLWDPQTNCIFVLKQSPSQIRHTFWHEATHAMLFYMGHKLYSNEQFVDGCAGILAQIMDTST